MNRETVDGSVEKLPIQSIGSDVSLNAVGGRGEVTAPEGLAAFADYVLVSLHCLRVYLEKTYRVELNFLSEMPQILEEVVLKEDNLLDHSTLVMSFDRFEMVVWRVLVRLSAQRHDLWGLAAIDATFFDREHASNHYCRRTNYRVQTMCETALVDTATQAVFDGALYGRETPRHTARLAKAMTGSLYA